jgi:hypothetical protein
MLPASGAKKLEERADINTKLIMKLPPKNNPQGTSMQIGGLARLGKTGRLESFAYMRQILRVS